nr:MAG TPA: hypothetical protein [Crassvirales sp.]
MLFKLVFVLLVKFVSMRKRYPRYSIIGGIFMDATCT